MDGLLDRLDAEVASLEVQIAELRGGLEAAEARRSVLVEVKGRVETMLSEVEALLEPSVEAQEQRSFAPGSPTPLADGAAPGGPPAAPAAPRTGRSRRERLIERLREQRPDLLELVERGELGVGRAACAAGWHKRAGRPKKEEPMQKSEQEQEPEEPQPPRIMSGVRAPATLRWPPEVEAIHDRLAGIEAEIEAAGPLDRESLLIQRRAMTNQLEAMKGRLLNSASAPLPEPHHGKG